MKRVLLICFGFVFLVGISCQKNKDENTPFNDTNKEHTAKNALDYYGVYTGVLPCADCDGIETTITLVDPDQYSISQLYLGKNDAAYEFNGTFQWDDSGFIITLKDQENGSNQYRVQENLLVHLDRDGKVIEGDLSEHYKLYKMQLILDSLAQKDDNLEEVTKTATVTTEKSVAKTTPADQLSNTKWVLKQLLGQEVIIPETATKPYGIVFNTDQRVFIYAGCNNMAGTFEIQPGNRITISKLMTTLMMCEDMYVEETVSSVIQTVDNYSLQGKTLTFNKAKMAPLMVFERIE